MNSKEFVAMTARMDGEAVVVKNIGRKCEVSEMELVVLCNMAHLACFDGLVDAVKDDDDLICEVEKERGIFVAALRKQFTNNQDNGLNRLMHSCVAMLGQERLGQYLVVGEEQKEDDSSQ